MQNELGGIASKNQLTAAHEETIYMRKAMMLLAVLALISSLWAADPMIGRWKLNISKSRLPPIQATVATDTHEAMDTA
jgi:hypothetical protein